MTFEGRAMNLSYPVIGKVSKTKPWLASRKDKIYVAEQIGKNLWGFAGLVTGKLGQESIVPKGKPCVFDLSNDELARLCEGDIVVLEPNGRVKVVWDLDSSDNSILATESCNCHCIMCPQANRKDQEDLFQFNMKLLKLVDPRAVAQIGITGGEPTLLEERLYTLLETCRKRFPGASIYLLTNGKKFKDLEFTRQIAKIGHPSLISCISLYSDTDTEHDEIVGVAGSFNETVRGLHNLALFGQKVEIRTVIMRQNYQRLPSLAEFIYRNFPFAIHVALMGLECTGLASANLQQVWIDPTEYAAELKSAAISLNRKVMHVSIYNLPLCLLPPGLWRFSRKAISTWKNVYLPQCEECQVRNKCGGLFATSERQSKGISPIKNGLQSHIRKKC